MHMAASSTLLLCVSCLKMSTTILAGRPWPLTSAAPRPRASGSMRSMAAPEFTHLHCHTEYSLLDGLSRVGPLMDAAAAQGMTSLALTDHGVMFGAIEFYKEARDRGIKPIIGIEAYVAPRSMEQREGKQDAGGHHRALLAQNEAGYRNLLTLATEAQLRRLHYKPPSDTGLTHR